jgi:hypothetical protein
MSRRTVVKDDRTKGAESEASGQQEQQTDQQLSVDQRQRSEPASCSTDHCAQTSADWGLVIAPMASAPESGNNASEVKIATGTSAEESTEARMMPAMQRASSHPRRTLPHLLPLLPSLLLQQPLLPLLPTLDQPFFPWSFPTSKFPLCLFNVTSPSGRMHFFWITARSIDSRRHCTVF